MVRAKVMLYEIAHRQGTSRTFNFHPIHDTSTEENRRFTKYTPSGQISLLVDNPAVEEQFKIGGIYYLDFTPAE